MHFRISYSLKRISWLLTQGQHSRTVLYESDKSSKESRKMKALPLAAAALAALATPTLAGGPTVIADDPMPAAMAAPAPVTDWSGPYAGLSYGRFSGDFSTTVGLATTPFDYDSDTGAGAFVGYNVQRGQLVYGGELSYSRTSMLIIADGDDFLDSLIDLRGRLGFSLGKALIYGSVGYSRGDLTINGVDNPTVSGSSYGVGIDVKMTQKLFVGVDYTSRNLSGTNDNPANTFDIDTKVNSVGLRVGFSF
jgi:outer membrane immunogenic protein